MKVVYSSASRERVELIEELASGGEGCVYKTNKPNILAKIYFSNSTERANKLKVMIKYPPVFSSLNRENCSLAWPIDLLETVDGECVGFLMPEIPDSKDLLNVYNHKQRQKMLPECNWFYLHVIAQNLASLLDSLHKNDYVVGDLKPENIFVNGTGRVSIIDVDSFQIQNPDTQKIYRCGFTSEEFTPPEMLGLDLNTIDRTEFQDRFGLAVVIWLLLFGAHPFSGIWLGEDEEETPNIDMRIEKGFWNAGFNSLIGPAPSTIPLTTVHPQVQSLFHRCFTDGHKDRYARPSAGEWFQALKLAITDLSNCSVNNNHYFSKQSEGCYWCEIKTRYDTDLFPSQSSENVRVNSQQSKRLISQGNPSLNSALPKISISHVQATSLQPSPSYHTQKQRAKRPRWLIWMIKTTLRGLLLVFILRILPDTEPPPLTDTDKPISEVNCEGIGDRIANTDPSINAKADAIFHRRYPTRAGKSIAEEDPEYLRKEWCSIAIELLEAYE